VIAKQEVTVWNGDLQPNHTYLFDGSKVVAYIAKGSKDAVYFKAPLNLDPRGRRFVTLKDDPFRAVEPKKHTVRVEGSRGAIYEVDTDEQTCTCSGFQFRRRCRHLNEALA